MNRRPSGFLIVVAVLVAILLIAPTVLVITMSFSSGNTLAFPPPGWSVQWYENFVTDQGWRDAFLHSLRVAAISTGLATVLGTATALGLVRGRFPLRGAAMGIVVSPMIVPVIVIAVGMYLFYVRWGLQGSMWGLVVAHTSLAMPLVIVNVMASLQNFDRNLEMAAQNLGAGPVRTFARITLPLILPGVIAGALFAFITSWDEVVTAIFLSSPLVRTLPVVMWTEVQNEVNPTIAAVASILTFVTILLFVSVLTARRLGSKKR
jgi:putative spermidine/putrescine transport system permease protein